MTLTFPGEVSFISYTRKNFHILKLQQPNTICLLVDLVKFGIVTKCHKKATGPVFVRLRIQLTAVLDLDNSITIGEVGVLFPFGTIRRRRI